MTEQEEAILVAARALRNVYRSLCAVESSLQATSDLQTALHIFFDIVDRAEKVTE